MLLLPGKPQLDAAPGLLPGTVTAVVAGVPMVVVDGATTALASLAGGPYAPRVGDRVGLQRVGASSGTNYLAHPLAVTSTPRGTLARDNKSVTPSLAGTTPLLVAKVAVTLDVARTYKVWTSQVLVESSVAGDYVQMRLVMSAVNGTLPAEGLGVTGTLLGLDNAWCQTANVAATTVGLAVSLDAPASGTYEIGAAFFRNSGTGNAKMNLAAGRSLDLVIEDIGSATPAT